MSALALIGLFRRPGISRLNLPAQQGDGNDAGQSQKTGVKSLRHTSPRSGVQLRALKTNDPNADHCQPAPPWLDLEPSKTGVSLREAISKASRRPGFSSPAPLEHDQALALGLKRAQKGRRVEARKNLQFDIAPFQAHGDRGFEPPFGVESFLRDKRRRALARRARKPRRPVTSHFPRLKRRRRPHPFDGTAVEVKTPRTARRCSTVSCQMEAGRAVSEVGAG